MDQSKKNNNGHGLMDRIDLPIPKLPHPPLPHYLLYLLSQLNPSNPIHPPPPQDFPNVCLSFLNLK